MRGFLFQSLRLTIENADMLVKRLDRDTANGVRWVTRRKGITGKGAQYFSVNTKSNPKMALEIRSPRIAGSVQGISSVDFRLNPKSRHPTAPTSVNEPR